MIHDTVIADSYNHSINNNNHTVIYYNDLRVQMDSEAEVSIINLLQILHNINSSMLDFKSRVRVYGATSQEIVTPTAVGYMRVRAFLKEVSVIEVPGFTKQYMCQGMRIFFAPNEEVLDKHIKFNVVKF